MPRRPSGTRFPTRRSRARAGGAGLAVFLALAAAAAVAAPAAAVVFVHAAPAEPGAPPGDGSADRPFRDLAQAVGVAAALAERASQRAGVPDAAVVLLAPGDYVLTPRAEVEPTCGNCLDPATPVPFTLGLRITGNRLRIEGAGGGPSVIHTRAGYGLLFQDCRDCALRGVVVTGGARDTSGLATDAAVVVQRSSVLIEDCVLRDNLGDPEIVRRTVAGIIGVAGREGARVTVSSSRLLRNSWDGIALYRDAEAEIVGNVIDGIDLATGDAVGGGRGVGIGATWNARASVRGNLVTRYWKGIGLFVDARATVEENIVERIATWGLSLWDAGSGRPQGWFRGNAVDSTGACGAMIARTSEEGDAGGLIGNAFVRTGQNPKYDGGEPYCLQTAVARHAAPEAFRIEENLFCANREAAGASGSGDVDREEFRRRARILCARLAAWPSLRGSRFLAEYGGTP